MYSTRYDLKSWFFANSLCDSLLRLWKLTRSISIQQRSRLVSELQPATSNVDDNCINQANDNGSAVSVLACFLIDETLLAYKTKISGAIKSTNSITFLKLKLNPQMIWTKNTPMYTNFAMWHPRNILMVSLSWEHSVVSATMQTKTAKLKTWYKIKMLSSLLANCSCIEYICTYASFGLSGRHPWEHIWYLNTK
jgi:hypothetical protein